jgi:TonB family protein
MNKLFATQIPLLLSLLLLVGPASSSKGRLEPSLPGAPLAVTQVDNEWVRLAPEREEFSVLTPATPSVMTQRANYAFEMRGEMVLEHETYSGYGNDFVFVIDSYRASHPQKIFERAVQNETGRASFVQDVIVDGLAAKEYRRDDPAFYNRILCFTSKKHVYVVTVAAREQSNPFLEQFLNSFQLSDQSVKRTPIAAGSPAAGVSMTASEVLSARDVSRKAVIVWKPQAAYTEQARSNHVTGRIVIKAVFGADGQVTDITVVSGLKDGLTEKAIEAARNIRFFPAEKDGRPVAQQLTVEYGFNLYP